MAVASLVCPHCEKPVELQVSGVTRSRPCPECGEMLMLQVAEKGNKTKRRALLMGGGTPKVEAERSINLRTTKKLAHDPLATPAVAAKAPILDTADALPPPPTPKSHRARAFEPKLIMADYKSPPSSPDKESGTEKNTIAGDRVPTTDSLPRPMVLEPSHEPQLLFGDAFDRMRMDPEVREFRHRLIMGSSVVAFVIMVVLLVHYFSGSPRLAKIIVEKPSEVQTLIPQEPEQAPVPPGSLVFKPPGKEDFQKATTGLTDASPRSSNPLSMDAALSIEVLRKFLSAKTWKERLQWVRPTTNIASMMETFYSKHADGPVFFENIVESPTDNAGFYEHTVVLQGGGIRQVSVEKIDKGHRVDWISFVGASEMSWSEFKNEKPTSPVVMRVMVANGFYYENQFGSPQVLKCLELRTISEPGAEMIYGYLEKGSAMTRQIEYWISQNKEVAIPLTLRLKYPTNAPSDRQVWVTEIVRQGWLPD